MGRSVILVIFCFLIISIPFCLSMELNLTYDDNGNLITGDEKYREYNDFNQLVRVYEGDDDSGDILETYIFHPTEDRILVKYTDYEGTNNPHTAILYINDNFIRKYTNLLGIPRVEEIYYIKDSSGVVSEVVRNVSYMDDNYELVKTSFYHNDHLGSISIVTNESGGVVEESYYSPYGEILEGGSSRYDYEGKEFSDITNDYDFNFRKYDTGLGIFTQPDSGVNDVYDPQSLNRYAFERRNPYKYVDPDGKVVITASALAAAAVMGFAIGVDAYALKQVITKQEITLRGTLGWGTGTSVGGVSALTVSAWLGAGVASSMLGGALSSAISGLGANVGEGNSFGSGLGTSVAVGAILGPLGKALPMPKGSWNIKTPLRFFARFSGQSFLGRFSLQESYGASYSVFSGSYQRYQIDQSKNSGSSSRSPSGEGYYNDPNSGGSVCRLPTSIERLFRGIKSKDPNPFRRFL